MEIRSPIKIVLRLQESPDEELDVATAFAKQPNTVREALLEAIRLIPLQSIDITLLRIENVFQSILKKPWKEPKTLRPLLEACRQGKVRSRTEILFSEHGKEFGVVALCLATTPDNRLFREIDPLRDDELIRLINNVKKIPKKAAMVEFIEEFIQTPKGIVSDPPPRLARPRTRKKGNVTPTGNLRSPSPQVTESINKKRRLYHGQVLPADGPLESIQNHLRLPSPHKPGLSALHHTPLNTTSSSQLIPRAFSFQRSQPQLSHYGISSSYLSQPNTPNPDPVQRADLVQPKTARPSQSQYRTQLINVSAGERLQQTLQMPGQGEEWDISGKEFIPARPLMFDSQTSQMPEQGEEWDILGKEFIPARPLMFDSQTSQMPEQGEEWDISGREFIPVRPLMFDSQTSQMPGQGEEWDILGREFVPGHPHIQNGQDLQTGQDEFHLRDQ